MHFVNAFLLIQWSDSRRNWPGRQARFIDSRKSSAASARGFHDAAGTGRSRDVSAISPSIKSKPLASRRKPVDRLS